jgi:hypothetical protein
MERILTHENNVNLERNWVHISVSYENATFQ